MKATILATVLTTAYVAGSFAFVTAADAAPGCRDGFYLVAGGLLCIPDPNYVAPSPAAPATQPATPPPGPAPAQPRPPVIVAPAQPTPAPTPPADGLGGGVVGPVQVIPGGGACSPGAVINILGNVYTCPPSGAVVLPPVPGQPPSAISQNQIGGPIVTH